MCLSPSLSHPHKAELVSLFHNPVVTHSILSPTWSFFLLKGYGHWQLQHLCSGDASPLFPHQETQYTGPERGKRTESLLNASYKLLVLVNSNPPPLDKALFQAFLKLSAQPFLTLTLEVIYAPPESNPSVLYRAPWWVVYSHFSTLFLK